MCIYFKIYPLVKEKKSFKGFFLYLALATIFFSMERNGLSKFGRE